MKFKKISAVLGTMILTGMTLGTAAAASYPAPFVESGAADVAIVYGTGVGVSSLDMVQATSIQTSLGSSVKSVGGTTTVEGGDAFVLQKASNNINFGNALNAVYTDLDDGELTEFLADGTYDDGDVDETFTQKITLGTNTLGLFADNDYDSKAPTVGFRFTNGDTILSYDLTFDDPVAFSDMNQTNMPLFGKEYYVLTSAPAQIEMLDSAEKTSISEGESLTVGGMTVSIYTIDANGVKFTVDGDNVDKLTAIGAYEEIGSTDSYIVLNDWNYDTRDGKVSMAEFSIGNGKITLKNGEEIEVNDEDVDELYATMTNSAGLTNLNIQWKSDDETFLTEADAITMPLFEAIKIVYGGLDYAEESETINFNDGEQFTIEMGNFDLPLFHWAGTDGATSTLGEEDYPLVTQLNNSWENWTHAGNLSGGLLLQEDDRFLVTSMDTDLSDIETMYYEVSKAENNSGTIEVTLEDLIGDTDITFDGVGVGEAQDNNGDITVTLVAVEGTTGAQAYLNFTAASGTLSYSKAVSDKGIVIDIPAMDRVDTIALDTVKVLNLTEMDKDEDVGEGTMFSVSVIDNSNDNLHVSTHNLTDYDEEGENDVYVGYVPSDLASMFTFDKSADEYSFELEYFGKEVAAEVTVASADATITSSGASALGDVLVKDTEVESVKAKNLVIVGGSCINSAAATVLGGAYCGQAFTDATGVAAGQFLIKGVQDAYTAGKLALVVAGYEAADTVNAATYLTMKDVDTSKEYKGTSATAADLVVA